jgi:hypothetical protein
MPDTVRAANRREEAERRLRLSAVMLTKLKIQSYHFTGTKIPLSEGMRLGHFIKITASV